MRKILGLLLINILAINILNAQQQLRIYGYVIDDNNRGIEDVVIQIENTTIVTTSNRNGYYEMSVEKCDSVELVFSLVNYQTIRQVIYPQRNKLSITVEMQPVSRELDAVGVTAIKRQTGTMVNMSAKNLRLTPNVAGGVEALLITAATGVSQNDELSSQYSVRGGNFDENSVYVNNIEVYRPLLVRTSQQEGLSFINPDLTENIAFSSGGFEPRYADKMSSVLDIQYKRPERTEASISLGLLGASAYFGTASKRFSQIYGIRYKTSNYLLGTLDTKGEYQPSFLDFQTFLTYQISPKLELAFLGNFSQNRYRFTPQTRETSFGTYEIQRAYKVYFDGWENDLFRTYFGALSLNFHPDKNLKMSVIMSAYHTNEKETFDITGAYTISAQKKDIDDEVDGVPLAIGQYHEHARNTLDATVASITYSGEYNINNNKIIWGITGQIERISDKINEWKWNDSAGYSLPYDKDIFNMFYSLKSQDTLNSVRTIAYIQDAYKWENSWGQWTVIGGVRGNFWSVNKELLVSPRAMIALTPWKRSFSFRFATGLYYQAPFYKELRQIVRNNNGDEMIVLNHNIKAQRSLHAVLGGDYYFRAWGRPFKFTTETYLKFADRVISYELENVNIRYSGLNDAKAYTAGIDFKLFGELIPGAETWINFSIMDSKEKINGKTFIINGKKHEWIPRPNSQRYVFSMLFQDYLPTNPKYRLHLRAIFADGMPFSAPGDVNSRAAFRASSGYRRIDIGTSRVFERGEDKLLNAKWLSAVKRIILNLEVFNLFDINNVNSYYWVSMLNGQQMAVPNYLTGRMFNFKITVDF